MRAADSVSAEVKEGYLEWLAGRSEPQGCPAWRSLTRGSDNAEGDMWPRQRLAGMRPIHHLPTYSDRRGAVATSLALGGRSVLWPRFSVGVDELANEESDEDADLSVEDDAAGPGAPGDSVSNREDGKHDGDNDGRGRSPFAALTARHSRRDVGVGAESGAGG